MCVRQIWKHFMVSRRGLYDWTSSTPGLKRLFAQQQGHPQVIPAFVGWEIPQDSPHSLFRYKLLILSCRHMLQLGNLWLRSIINTYGFTLTPLERGLWGWWVSATPRNPLMCSHERESGTHLSSMSTIRASEQHVYITQSLRPFIQLRDWPRL